MTNPRKTIIIVLATMLLILGAAFWLYSPAIFQEGNPWPQIKGATQLLLGKDRIVKLDNGYHMTRTAGGYDALRELVGRDGYRPTEQLGSGFFFRALDGRTLVVTHRYYSRQFSLWKISQGEKLPEPSIAEQIRQCMALSNWASHETCLRLIATINDFDSCVAAGFSIMKSNPPQCATPDGRTFVEK